MKDENLLFFLEISFTYVNVYVNILTNEIRRCMRKEGGTRKNAHNIYKKF